MINGTKGVIMSGWGSIQNIYLLVSKSSRCSKKKEHFKCCLLKERFDILGNKLVELDKKIDTLMSISLIWSYSQQLANLETAQSVSKNNT